MATKRDKAKDFSDFRKDLEALMSRVFDMEGFSSATSEMKKNTKATLQGFANKFDLVSREEFRAQQKTLAEAVKKLGEIEKKLDRIAGKPKPTKTAKKPAKRKPAAKKAKPAADAG